MTIEIRKLRQRAARGDSIAALACAIFAERAPEVTEGSGAAERLYKQAATELPIAQFLLAAKLLKRQETAVEGFKFAERAAKAGLPEAAVLVGHAYKLGLGTITDDEKARIWYLIGAELGDPDGFFWLGSRYVDDMGNFTSPHEAKAWFERAVEAGHVASKSFLAKVLLKHTTPPEVARAMALLKEGADQGDFGALMTLSSIYRHGLHGVAQSMELADKYLALAQPQIGRIE
jgi:TPR repeat protein